MIKTIMGLIATGLLLAPATVLAGSDGKICNAACIKDIHDSFAQGKVSNKDTQTLGTFTIVKFTTMSGKERTAAIDNNTSKMYVIQLSELEPSKTGAVQGSVSGSAKIKSLKLDRAFSVADNLKHKASDKDIYAFIDPNCPFCHTLMTAVQRKSFPGYKFHFIPVRVLGDTSGAEVSYVIEHDFKSLMKREFKQKASYETAEAAYNKSAYDAVAKLSGKSGVPLIVSPSGNVHVGFSKASKLRKFLEEGK